MVSNMEAQIKESQAQRLREIYGTHENVAAELGISSRHYIRLRKGRPLSPTLAKLIEMMLEKESPGR